VTARKDSGWPPDRRIVILGASGSIGRQGLEVAAAVPGLSVVGLVARRSVAPVLAEARRLGVGMVGFHDPGAAAQAAAHDAPWRVFAGDTGVAELIATAAADASAAGAELVVLNGIVGAAGLRASLATLACGATLALANKESMVAGGPFVLDAARRRGSVILPVDSEHSAIFQCLAAGTGATAAWAGATAAEAGATVAEADATAAGGAGPAAGGAPAVEEILLTGSGGPFRGRKAAELGDVTPAQALKHPNWSMGPKITIDSATLMNKGLEIIEAHYLFGVPYERITVVVSPQSVVHSMVRFADGAVFAHLGVPDMRTPIGYALAYPQRPALPMVRRLDLFATQLSFDVPDLETFRCLELAVEAGKKAAIVECGAPAAVPKGLAAAGRSGPAAACPVRTVAAPIVLNAANEVAVQAFLEGRLPFLGIAGVVEKCLTWLGDEPVESVEDVYACDGEARRFAREASGRPA